jgi:acetyl-CoA acetyltransferase
MPYEGDACVVGIGTSEEFGFDLGKSPMRLQVEAFSGALSDAGLQKSAIDGFATAHGSPLGVDYEEFVLAAGLECRWISQMWTHGRWATTSLADAALAVSAGLADYIAVANTSMRRKGYARHLSALGGGGTREGLRDTGGGHGEWEVHGADSPGSATSLTAQRYMDRYGATAEDLASVAIAFREHAAGNPLAIMRDKKMTLDSYFAEPVISGPFRRADFCLTNDGSTCLIVTTRERARDLPGPAVVIAGFEGIKASRDDYILFSRPGLGTGISAEFPFTAQERPRSYQMAGVDRSEIDGLYMYDSFGSNLWMVLERWGFCGEGEAPSYVRDVGIGLDSRLPVNTNGGLMSEGHFSGYAHLVEMVRQLRGQAGSRQIPDASVLQWSAPWGDALILTKP